MVLDPHWLLAIAALGPGTSAALMLRAARRDPRRPAMRDCGLGLAAGAIGLATTFAAPAAIAPPMTVLGVAAMLFGAGFLWAAVRRLAGGAEPRPAAVAAGAIGWLWIVLAAMPPLGWRIAIGTTILAAYVLAAVVDLLRNPDRGTGSLTGAAGVAIGAIRAAAARAFRGARPRSGPPQGRDAAFATDPAPRVEPRGGARLEDALTGVANRHALTGSGAALVAAAAAAGHPLALLLMDLDGFEPLLARHGAEAGERLLVAFARLAHDYLPPTSLVCRLDGDLFAALLPGAAPARALAVADELRSLFAHLALDGAGGALAATVSIGIAQVRPGRSALPDLLEAAVGTLSAAKAAGRNFVLHEAELPGGGMHAAA